MSLRNVFLLLLVVVLAVFTIVNWSAFIAPTTLSLVVATVNAPLGLIMLVITGLLAALFLAYVTYLQSTVILEARRSAREITAQREIADRAEASRFTELRMFLEERLGALASAASASEGAMKALSDQSQQSMKGAVDQGVNTLSAYLAEVEDRLERRIDGGRPARA